MLGIPMAAEPSAPPQNSSEPKLHKTIGGIDKTATIIAIVSDDYPWSLLSS